MSTALVSRVGYRRQIKFFVLQIAAERIALLNTRGIIVQLQLN